MPSTSKKPDGDSESIPNFMQTLEPTPETQITRFLVIASAVKSPFAVPLHPTALITSRISTDGSRPAFRAISSQ